jgi:single-strand selective monofunctional uracil DNA glycosylase
MTERGDLVEVTRALARATSKLEFGPPVAHVYRPLEYAWSMTEAYLTRFGRAPKEILLLGMNPGPFGMAQTGVPFGDVVTVRDWLALDGRVTPPKDVHPKRPVLGLACTRVEVSGARLWGAIAKRHPDPKTFFARAIVLNYCPLLFLDEKGANLTPDKLRPAERAACEAVCDVALTAALSVLRPRLAVGVGLYARKRLEKVWRTDGERARIASIPHPSPASPQANRGWDALARSALEAAGVRDLL